MSKSSDHLRPDTPTIVIPAHNESEVIAHCLEALATADAPAYQIIVICNGCSDETAQIVQQQFPQCHVAELPEPDKVEAIKFAESFNPGFPRLYLDADIRLEGHDATLLLDYAKDCDGLVVPGVDMSYRNSPRIVHAYYGEWLATDFVKKLGFGAGAFVLSRSARQRFESWPSVVNEDGYLRYLFAPEEIHILETTTSQVTAPGSLAGLLKIKSRSRFGNRQLERLFGEPPNRFSYLPKSLMGGFVYLLVNSLSLCLALWQEKISGFRWLRDR